MSKMVMVRSLDRFIRKLRKGLTKEMKKAPYNILRIDARQIKRQLLLGTKLAPRNDMASKIRVLKHKKYNAELSFPAKAMYLDRMKPHYVPLRRGTKVTRWVDKYFKEGMERSHRSVVYNNFMNLGRKTKGGNPVYVKGFLYVKPHPFINQGIRQAYSPLKKYLLSLSMKIVKESLK